MNGRNTPKRKVAREMTEKEILAALADVGKLIQKKRKESYSSADIFAYEIGISRSNMNRHEKGYDMRLSTFLKIIAGLGVSGQEFFRDLEK